MPAPSSWRRTLIVDDRRFSLLDIDHITVSIQDSFRFHPVEAISERLISKLL